MLKQAIQDRYGDYEGEFPLGDLEPFITSLLASERADWLRSEIEKLEGMRKRLTPEEENTSFGALYENIGHNAALTSIITRYTEELKVLESK